MESLPQGLQMRQGWIFVLATVLGCEGGESAETPEPAAPIAEEAPPADKTFDVDALKADAETIALVPSPAEMQKALSNAGLESRLSTLVPKRDIAMDVENKDQLAVRTGVVLADLVLTVQDAPKEDVVDRLGKLKTGFERLGAGSDIQATIDDISARVQNDAVSREDLLKEMDELSGVMVPELEMEAGDWVVPLVQAGSWLEGAHLVSGAIKAEGKFDSAGSLLRQPAVVDYFLKYVEREGTDKAPDEVVDRLKQTLHTLKEVASKETLTEADVDTVHSATASVLTML